MNLKIVTSNPNDQQNEKYFDNILRYLSIDLINFTCYA